MLLRSSFSYSFFPPATTSLALSEGIDKSDCYAAVRTLRSVTHERLRKRLFLLEQDARLRSGTRGIKARKSLSAFEKVAADSRELFVALSVRASGRH